MPDSIFESALLYSLDAPVAKPTIYERPSQNGSREGQSILDASSEMDSSVNLLSEMEKPSARKMRQEMKMKKYMML